jgi:hypothetical protein
MNYMFWALLSLFTTVVLMNIIEFFSGGELV